MLKNIKKIIRVTYNQIRWFFNFFIKSPAFELYVKKLDKINRNNFSQIQEEINSNTDNYLKQHYAKELPKTIWIYWEQGENNAPLIVQKCIASWKQLNNNCDIIVLNKTTISNYIDLPNLPESLPTRYKADLYRLMLLNKHGGIWADATTYCHRPISEWLPLFFSSGFFIFSNPSEDRDIESWFIVSTSGHPLISSWEYEFKKYICNYKKLPSAYFIMFYIFQWMLKKDKKLNQYYRQSSSLNATPCFFMKSVLTNITKLQELYSLIGNGLPLSKLDWRLDISDKDLTTLFDEIEKISR